MADDDLTKAKADLANAHRAREILLASVAHDLRNPLNTFAMSAGLLREDLETPDFDRTRALSLVTRMDRAALRMQLLIDDLVEASKIEAGGIEYTKKAEDVRGVVRAAIERARPSAADKGASLREGPTPDDAKVEVDRTRTAQALTKLVAVALKTTGEGGVIEIGAVVAGPNVRFLVQTGGSRSPHDESRGGLALLIARGLVQRQGGTVMPSDDPHGMVATFPLL